MDVFIVPIQGRQGTENRIRQNAPRSWWSPGHAEVNLRMEEKRDIWDIMVMVIMNIYIYTYMYI